MVNELQDLRRKHQVAAGLAAALKKLGNTLTMHDPLYNKCNYKIEKYAAERDTLAPRLSELELMIVRSQLEQDII